MNASAPVVVEEVWKTFRIFQTRNTTLKQAVTRRRGDTFEDFWALRGVSFEVPHGSTFGLIGANGAGKSTMLKVLARILVPDRGRVVTQGKLSALLELGAGFHPELSGRENIFLNGSILGMSKAMLQRKFDEIVSFSGLEAFIDQPVKTYSSGMYARLGFSVAVAVEPDVLLVDEVLAVGDEQFQRRCAERMSELRSGGRTVILVTHSLGQVQQLCDHAIWIDHGVVRAGGPTQDVVAQYLASVTTAYRLDGQGRQRVGSGEVEMEVELLTPEGISHIATDMPVTIRIHWRCEQQISNVAFSFATKTADGYVLGGSWTLFDHRWDALGPGSGYVDYVVPSLPLLPGSYQLGAAISDRITGHLYDQCPNIVEFDVASNPGHEADRGAMTLRGTWVEGTKS